MRDDDGEIVCREAKGKVRRNERCAVQRLEQKATAKTRFTTPRVCTSTVKPLARHRDAFVKTEPRPRALSSLAPPVPEGTWLNPKPSAHSHPEP